MGQHPGGLYVVRSGPDTAGGRAPDPGSVHARFPVLPRTYVRRPQLWDRLDAATRGPVTLLVAPAGAGKTLGVAGWVRTRRPAGSVTWATASDDLDVAALDALLHAGAAAQTLIVVDDAHLLPPATVDRLDRLLSENPDRLRLLLLSRWDLWLSRLVPELLGHLTVLRGGVLRMDKAEVRQLVAHHARTVDEQVVDAVAQLAQGWCAVAVLAAKSVGADRDPRAAAHRLLEGHTTATDRIMGEVFTTLTPPQRHLLLCVAAEPRVTATTARHLSQDDRAGRLLEDLVSTGLLVTRHEPLDVAGRVPGRGGEATFEIHPLLHEIVLRTVRSGSKDVLRARASVRSAVDGDLARGETLAAFRRLQAMDAVDDVLHLLTERGVQLAVDGHLGGLGEFVRKYTAALERRPPACLAVALERWLAGDLRSARAWWVRASRPAEAPIKPAEDSDEQLLGLTRACAALLLARTSGTGLGEAVDAATAELGQLRRVGVGEHPTAQLLRLETAVAEMRRGRLPAAERLLSAAVSRSETGHDAVAVAATAQLAVVQYLEGRERTCLELAEQVLREGRGHRGPMTARARETADAARGLAAVQRLVVVDRREIGDEDLEETSTGRVADPVVDTLRRLLRARSLLLKGAVARAEQVLSVGAPLDELPDPVVRLVLLERALLALTASDWQRMSRLQLTLAERGDAAEAALVAGLRADASGDPRAALDLYGEAAAAARAPQPPTRAMALACRAQLLDAEGRSGQALDALAEAAEATRLRRTALPFLGWSRHGTRPATLLRRLAEQLGSDWVRQLAIDAQEATPGGVLGSAAIRTPTPRERAQVPDGVMRPSLSPRERDVLLELARGSTYADIAANLFVSENTVKTHVSSLYSKLAVSRRSDALAVARTLGVL